jgi:hypothetical protein
MKHDPSGEREWRPLAQPDSNEPAQKAGYWYSLAAGAFCLAAMVAGGHMYLTGDESPSQPDNACNLRVGSGELRTGRVVRFLSAQEALDLVQVSQQLANGTLDPDYLTQQRVALDGGATVLVPHSMTVRLGDTVEFAGGHRATHLPCHYVPNLISRVIAPGAESR